MVEISVISRFQKDDKDLGSVLSVLNYAWAAQIVMRLNYYGQLRYNRIKNSLRNISSTSLSRTLSFLKENGIVYRGVLETTPPGVVYGLTAKGKELADIVERMHEAGSKWNNEEEIVVAQKVLG